MIKGWLIIIVLFCTGCYGQKNIKFLGEVISIDSTWYYMKTYNKYYNYFKRDSTLYIKFDFKTYDSIRSEIIIRHVLSLNTISTHDGIPFHIGEVWMINASIFRLTNLNKRDNRKKFKYIYFTDRNMGCIKL